MSVYVVVIENGVLKKFIPRLLLRKITLPSNVHTIASFCFSPWSPTELPLGEWLNSWEEYFPVESVVIPKQVQHIEKLAFADMPKLKNFIIEKGCVGAKTHKNILYSGDGKRLLFCPSVNCGEYILPNGVQIISENAFEDTHLTNIFLPDSVTTIEDDAFSGGLLKSIYIPWSVTSIGERVFENCNDLIIKTPWNSYALEYAKKHGIAHEEILYYL